MYNFVLVSATGRGKEGSADMIRLRHTYVHMYYVTNNHVVVDVLAEEVSQIQPL